MKWALLIRDPVLRKSLEIAAQEVWGLSLPMLRTAQDAEAAGVSVVLVDAHVRPNEVLLLMRHGIRAMRPQWAKVLMKLHPSRLEHMDIEQDCTREALAWVMHLAARRDGTVALSDFEEMLIAAGKMRYIDTAEVVTAQAAARCLLQASPQDHDLSEAAARNLDGLRKAIQGREAHSSIGELG